MWLRLNTKKSIETENGRITYFPGDWLDAEFGIGRQWLMVGIASVPCLSNAMPLDKDCGIVALCNKAVRFAGYPDLQVKASKKPAMSHAKTLVLSKSDAIAPEMLSFCFDLLDRWDVIAPFNDGYSDECVFVKKSEAASTFIKQWAKFGFSEALAESGLNIFGLPVMAGVQ